MLKMSLEEKLRDLWDHCALEGHREYTYLLDNQVGGTGPIPMEFVHVVSCCRDQGQPHGCMFEVRVSETEVAAAGRLDLCDRWGWGAEIERAKAAPARERPTAWSWIWGD